MPGICLVSASQGLSNMIAVCRIEELYHLTSLECYASPTFFFLFFFSSCAHLCPGLYRFPFCPSIILFPRLIPAYSSPFLSYFLASVSAYLCNAAHCSFSFSSPTTASLTHPDSLRSHRCAGHCFLHTDRISTATLCIAVIPYSSDVSLYSYTFPRV